MNTFQLTNKEWLQIKREIVFVDYLHSYDYVKRIQNKKGNFIIRIEIQRV